MAACCVEDVFKTLVQAMDRKCHTESDGPPPHTFKIEKAIFKVTINVFDRCLVHVNKRDPLCKRLKNESYMDA